MSCIPSAGSTTLRVVIVEMSACAGDAQVPYGAAIGQVVHASTGPDSWVSRTLSRAWRSLATSGRSREMVASLPGATSTWLQLSMARAAPVHARMAMPARMASPREHACVIEHLPFGSSVAGRYVLQHQRRVHGSTHRHAAGSRCQGTFSIPGRTGVTGGAR